MAKTNNLENDVARKSVVYGVNYLSRLIGNELQPGLNLGHPYAALGFGIADIITGSYKPLKESIYNSWLKVGGAAYFSFLTVKNLVEFIEGDYAGLKDFPFNLSMAWSLGTDAKQLVNKTGIIPKKKVVKTE